MTALIKNVNFGFEPIFPRFMIRKNINFIPDARVIAHFVGILILINHSFIEMLQKEEKPPKNDKNCQKQAILAAILNFLEKYGYVL